MTPLEQTDAFEIEERVAEQPKVLPRRYHDSHEVWSGSLGYNPLLKDSYKKALGLSNQAGRNPFLKKEPRALLCGTASSQTTSTFIQFAREQNPNTEISILDLSRRPLERSAETIQRDPTIDPNKIRLVQADATNSGFESGEFDLIETDFFLQFFPIELKRMLIAEWKRILSEDGVITTRDWILNPSENIQDRLFNIVRRSIYKTAYGIDLQTISQEDLAALFAENGLQTEISQDSRNRTWSRFVKHVIAYN